MSILILGIGNNLLTDEGAGIHAINYLKTHHTQPENVEYMDGGTLSFTLASPIADSEALIIIDASELKKPAGSIEVFEGDAMDQFIGSNRKRSVHEVSLIDLLSINRLTDDLPEQRALIGIQPNSVDWGESPCDAVKEAIPRACDMALKIVERWQQS